MKQRLAPVLIASALALVACERPGPPVVTPIPTTAPTTTAPVGTKPPSGDLTWGLDATAPDAGWTKPALGAIETDPIYGTTVRRVTSAEGTRFDRNTYSRRQAENADGTLFFSYHGDAEYRVYDRSTLELVRTLDIHPDAEPQWHPTDASVIRHITGPNSYVGDLRYLETDVRTGTETVIADLTDRIQAVLPTAQYMLDKAEGSPSADGRRMAWIVFDGSENPIGLVSYDLGADQVLGIAPLETGDVGNLDWVSMSPNGDYVVAGYWYATIAYDADLTDGRTINEKADHSDIALSADGRDTYVYIDFSSGPDGGWLMAVDLETLTRTRLVNLYDDANTSIHISGKGYDKPGWIVASTYSCKVDGAWSCSKVMAIELGGTQRVLNLAHTYNCGDDYWTETQAVVNRDFTRVYFNSDGGSCGTDAEVYELTLPAFD